MKIKHLFAIGLCLASVSQVEASGVTGYVVGGTPVKPTDDQSWMASLRLASNQLSHMCGGTVIDRQWVLTAAHCVVHEVEQGRYMVLPPSQLNLMVGSPNITVEDTAALYAVSHVVVHPDYSPDAKVRQTLQPDGTVVKEVMSTALDNDIALLRVDRPFADNISPVVLATGEMADEIDSRLGAQWSDTERPENTRVSGWGATQTDGTGAPHRLMEAFLSFVPMPECFNRLELGNEANYIIDSAFNRTKVCALPPSVLFDSDGNTLEFGSDGCKGDSGGPLRAKDELDNWVQFGIVSGGPVGKLVCGSLARPSFYTRVGTYYPWIESKVGTIPDRPVTKPEFIEEQEKESAGNGGGDTAGQGGSGTTSGKEDQIDTSKCNSNVDGVAHTNCNLAESGGGASSWFGLLILAFWGWRRRLKNC